MRKDRRPTGHDVHKAITETTIDNRDRTIRELIDELVSGTQELKLLYSKESTEHDSR